MRKLLQATGLLALGAVAATVGWWLVGENLTRTVVCWHDGAWVYHFKVRVHIDDEAVVLMAGVPPRRVGRYLRSTVCLQPLGVSS